MHPQLQEKEILLKPPIQKGKEKGQRERERRTSVYAAGNGASEDLERKMQSKGLEDGCATEGF